MNQERRKNKQQITVLPSDRFQPPPLECRLPSLSSPPLVHSLESQRHERSPDAPVSLMWVPCHFLIGEKKSSASVGENALLSPHPLQGAEGSSVGKACAEGHTGREETA